MGMGDDRRYYGEVAKTTKLKIKLAEGAKMPERIGGEPDSFRIFSNERIELAPGQRAIVPTGMFSEFDEGLEMRVLNFLDGCMIVNAPGTVDADYRGDIGVIMKNLMSETFVIERGDPVADIKMHSYINPSSYDNKSHGSAAAAGYDIFSVNDVEIAAGSADIIRVEDEFGFDDKSPQEIECSVRGRSGNAAKLGLYVREDRYICDSDKFAVKAIWAINHGEEDIVLPAGSKVAQCVFSEANAEKLLVELEQVEELSETVRGAAGMNRDRNGMEIQGK